ncbi:MAG: c-type cytochrome biogenesis protein CcmI [Paracoccaceae bacterium]
MNFWIIAFLMGAIVAVPMFLALRRGDHAASRGVADIDIYRDQLRHVDRDLDRGVIGPAEAERLRTEVSRRVLEADRAARSAPAQTAEAPAAATAAGFVVVVAIAAALWGYWDMGAPDYPDLPLASRIAAAEKAYRTRPDQAEAEATLPAPAQREGVDPGYLELVEKLRVAVAEHPERLQGQTLLAQSEAALGNYPAAHAAQAQVIALKGDRADAQDYAALADLMVLAAGGYVSPEAEVALAETLRRDPKNGTARYYAGLVQAQNDRPDRAFQIWKALLEDSPAEAPWVGPIREQIEVLAGLAGVRYTLPDPAATTLPGPDAAAIAEAGEMSQADRAAMIRGMVDQLSERLASEGGSAEEWARLITAHGVLGETDKAKAARDTARNAFAGDDAALAVIEAAAAGAGLNE